MDKQNPLYAKDIRYIEVTYFEHTGKKRTKITLNEKIIRVDALKIIGIINSHPDVFDCRGWTENNTFI